MRERDRDKQQGRVREERSGHREDEVEHIREMIQQISSYRYIVSTDLIGKLSFFTLPSTQTHMNSLSIA